MANAALDRWLNIMRNAQDVSSLNDIYEGVQRLFIQAPFEVHDEIRGVYQERLAQLTPGRA